jgi:L-asparagine transporter-like permease
MGITEILTIVFVVLKLLKVINWHWLLVLSPELLAVVVYVMIVISQIKLINRIKKDLLKGDK